MYFTYSVTLGNNVGSSNIDQLIQSRNNVQSHHSNNLATVPLIWAKFDLFMSISNPAVNASAAPCSEP